MSGLEATALKVPDRGRNIDATVTGQGSVTVVLLTGLGAPAQWWYDLAEDAENLAGLLRSGVWTARPFLAPSLGAFARVVSYDRAGIAGSTPPQSSRKLEDFVTELKAVLDATCPSDMDSAKLRVNRDSAACHSMPQNPYPVPSPVGRISGIRVYLSIGIYMSLPSWSGTPSAA
ncbi:alpha/beta fold hydrolase [Deinococcus sp.]|uniref:alpha/beta fold hydrolase n=1 Tax=Deinococcus sp. TaxID=47478 RepID=UPI003C7BB2DD